jgi:hypothetical protein
VVGRAFSVSPDSIRRHLRDHLPDILERSQRFQERYGDGLTERLERHEQALVELLRAAAAGENAPAAIGALRDLTRLYRAVRRVSRRFGPPSYRAGADTAGAQAGEAT